MKTHKLGIVLIGALAVIVAWESFSILARRSQQHQAYASDPLHDLHIHLPDYRVSRIAMPYSPTEPNVLARVAKPLTPAGVSATFRLVHGFNMHDCMRLKGYQVELIADKRESATDLPIQMWKLTSPTQATTLWLTTVLERATLHPTDRDMRSIPFPRITSPMAQDWNPQGLQLASLRHPIRNFRQMLKAKWNNAHCDPLVFAGIKATPWAEQESYTYITITVLPDDTKNESAMQQATQSLHAAFLSALQKATD